MTLAEIKEHLRTAEAVNFLLPNGELVPEHFHVTEVGLVTKHFIDCGGMERIEKVANFQLWDANDYEHRLKPKKLLGIITLCERKLNIGDLPIEVEYQSGTIGKYDLSYNGHNFLLIPKQTACLAKESCGVPQINESLEPLNTSCCAPSGGCC